MTRNKIAKIALAAVSTATFLVTGSGVASAQNIIPGLAPTQYIGPNVGYGGSKIDICHKSGNVFKPYTQISIALAAIPAHAPHGDIIPVQAGGCPAKVVNIKKTVWEQVTGIFKIFGINF